MQRRRLLTTLTSASTLSIAGCLGTGDGTPDDPPDERPEFGVEVSLDDPAGEVLEIDAEVVDPESANGPPELELEVRNPGDEPVTVYLLEPSIVPQFWADHADDDASIQLIPEDEEHVYVSLDPAEDEPESLVPSTPENGCWQGQVEAGPSRGDAGPSEYTLDPTDSIARSLTILNTPTNDECFPSGTYEPPEPVPVRLGPELNLREWSELDLRITVDWP